MRIEEGRGGSWEGYLTVGPVFGEVVSFEFDLGGMSASI